MGSDFARQLGWDKLSPEAQQKLTEGMGEALLGRLVVRCKPLLKRKQRKEFEGLWATDPEAALRLLQDNIPDFQAIVQEEAAGLRQEATNTHDAVMKKLGRGQS